MNEPSPKNKNETKQDYGTDKKFWKVLNSKYDFEWDLACTKENCLVRSGASHYGYDYPEYNAFEYTWHNMSGWLYLNPPFSDIRPWVQKCYEESLQGAKIVLLTPASVGSKWFNDFVFNKAYVFFLKGRLTFEGMKPNPKTGKVDPYPKDCMISVFDNFHTGFNIWEWNK